MTYKLIHGDCIEVMRRAKAGSVDAVICDPPYELGFMSKSWDDAGVSFDPETWRAAMRVMKPGAHLLAFGGTRTYHRIAVAIEDAGFEIRDCIMWMYGSGFPKSHNVANSIDKMLGHPNRGKAIPTASSYQASDVNEENKLTSNKVEVYESRSPESEPWNGWGTALKPAYEPVIVARKPLTTIGKNGRPKKQTVAANVLEHGTGALNIDGCRIATDESLNGGTYSDGGNKSSLPGDRRSASAAGMFAEGGGRLPGQFVQPEGRWPANVILDETAGAMLDAQVEPSISRKGKPRASADSGDGWGMTATGAEYDDRGGPSRFFYCAKTSKKERNAGLDSFDEKAAGGMAGRHDGSMGSITMNRNVHPTVKPIDLMRYLCRLVTPPNGVVLDPFMGSGSTGCAALLEGFRFVGIEMDDEYMQIARARIEHWSSEA